MTNPTCAMLLEGGKVGKESPMSILPHDVEPSFRRSSGENQTLPMINMIIYIYISLPIDQNTATCMVEYSMIRSAGVAIAFKSSFFSIPESSCQAGVVALTYMPFGGLRCTRVG